MSLLSPRSPKNIFCALNIRLTKTCAREYLTVKNNNTPETTVDAKEVDHLSKLRDQWWQPNGPVKPLHALNLLRVPFVRDGLVQVPLDQRSSTPLTGKTILDVGCGGGILSMPLAKLGADVTGVDASKELIEMAQQHSEANPPLPGKQPLYLCTTIEEHSKTHSNFYDGVVASEIIEHIANDKKELFVKSCIHTVKPGGRIFFTTPSKTRISQLATIYIAENILHAIPKGTHQYDKFTTSYDLSLLLNKNGCHVESVSGFVYNFLMNKWLWIGDTAFSFALQAIKL